MESIRAQGVEPIRRLLPRYSLPAIAGFLASALYLFVDRILVGRGVGTEGMAAVTSAYPLTILCMGVGLLLGTGTGNRISTLLGKERRDEAEAVLGQSVRLALLWGGLLVLLLGIFAEPVLRACGARGTVLAMAVPFLRWSLPGQFSTILVISMGSILRVQGRPLLGLVLMAGGNLLNGLLAALAIFGLGWGVSGAAAATSISAGLSLSLILGFVQGPSSHLRIRARHLRPDPALARLLLAQGAPVFLMQVLGTATFLAANHGALALDGARGVALVGVFNAVSMLLIYPPLGVAQAMQPLVAYNLGAGKPERVRRILAGSLLATAAMAVVSVSAVLAAPRAVAGLFSRDDLRLVEAAADGLPWFMLSVGVFWLQGTASHYFLATQQAGRAAILLLGRQILAIPLFLTLPAAWGLAGLYLVPALSDLPFALLAAAMLRREWKRLPAGAEPADRPGSEETETVSASGTA